MQVFSSCGKQGPVSSCGAQASHCSGFSCCRARAPEHGLQSTGSVVVGEWAQLRGMRDHPRPGLNPVVSISKNTAITQDAGVSRMEGVLSVC